MPTTTSRRTVRVHRTERSTEQERLWPYLETLTVLVAIVAIAAAAWVAAAPGDTADLPAAAPTAPASTDLPGANPYNDALPTR